VKGGHDVHVLAPPMDVTWLVQATTGPLSGNDRRPTPAHCLSCVGLVDDLAPDVIHLHSFIAGFFGRLPGPAFCAHRQLCVPTACLVFDLFQLRGVGTMIRWWERRASRRTDMLVANCQDEIDEGRSVGIDTPAEPLGVAVRTDQFVSRECSAANGTTTATRRFAPSCAVVRRAAGQTKGSRSTCRPPGKRPPSPTLSWSWRDQAMHRL
jgi:hypothetical protein